MKLAYNPSDKPALTGISSDNKDIIFDLSGIAIYARGVKFDGKTPTVFKKHTSANTGGYDGLVPAPSYADSATRFLREDGTWVIPDKTTSIHWNNIDGKPNVFNPSQHIHTTDDIKSLINYTKATELKALTTSDTLNVALGKLEYKSDLGVTAYNWYKSVTDEDTDEHINKWNEIVDFLNGVTDTTLNGILNNFVNDLEVTGSGNAVTNVSKSNNKITVTKGNSFLPLSGGRMDSSAYISWNSSVSGNDVTDWNEVTGNGMRIISSIVSTSNAPIQYSTALHIKGRYGFQIASAGGAYDKFYVRNIAQIRNWVEIIHSGNIGSQSVASAAKLTTARTIWGQSFDGTGDVDGTIKINSREDIFEAITIHNDWYTTDVFKYTDIRLLSYPSGTRGGAIRVGTGNYGMFNSMSFGKMENGDSYTPYIFINSSGYVGIGTTGPSYKLDVNGTARASGFIKSGSSSAYVLTGDGGHKAISDFAAAGSLGNYLPLAGGTMNLGEGLKFHADENYFGTYSDARIISLLDGNGTTCDGGLIIDERATLNGTEHVTELLRIRDAEFKWRGLDILHSGNYTNYTVTKTGSGASGTWGINISGNAATATNARYVIADNNAKDPGHALLQSGSGRTDSSPSGDTWIYYDSLGGTSSPWGIKHEQASNLISFYGGGTRRAYIDLSNGNISCSTINGYTPITSGNIGAQSVNYATSAGNADKVDGYHETSFFRYLGAANTASVWSWGTRSGASGWNSTASDRGYRGRYGTNLDISGYFTWYHRFAMCTDGRIEYWMGINTTTLTKQGVLAWTSDIPTVTNYYWADQKISSSSNAATSPTFAKATATTSIETPLVQNASGILTLNGKTNIYLKINDTDSLAINLAATYLKPFGSAKNLMDLGTSNARWKGVYANTGNFSSNVTITGTMSSANYLLGTALELKTDDTACQTTVFGSNNSGYRMRIVRQATSSNLNILYSPTLVLSSLDTHAYIAWSYYSDSVWVGGGAGNKWNWRSKLVTSTNYGSYLGYIGTTAVQSSSKTQELTGITNATMSGTTTTKNLVVSGANQYREAGGIILNNSDIWGLNAIYTSDLANAATEGYLFKRTNGNYDSLWCKDGVFYFSPNGNSTDGYSTNYTILHSGNSSVSGGGSSAGSSLAVKINGATKTLTIPSSLPANGGNADTVDGYHIAVQSSAGTNASTIYFVI